MPVPMTFLLRQIFENFAQKNPPPMNPTNPTSELPTGSQPLPSALNSDAWHVRLRAEDRQPRSGGGAFHLATVRDGGSPPPVPVSQTGRESSTSAETRREMPRVDPCTKHVRT